MWCRDKAIKTCNLKREEVRQRQSGKAAAPPAFCHKAVLCHREHDRLVALKFCSARCIPSYPQMTPCYPKMVPLATQEEFGPILKTCPLGRERCTCAKNQQCSIALWQVCTRTNFAAMHALCACGSWPQACLLACP
jgi:hypothetical protein